VLKEAHTFFIKKKKQTNDGLPKKNIKGRLAQTGNF
jgi:hypothetical protein